MLTPPGDRFVQHPSEQAGLPRTIHHGPATGEQNSYTPAQFAWHKQPATQAQIDRPITGLGTPYLVFHRFYSDDLAYFELSGACAYFHDPAVSRNELRFPTLVAGQNGAGKTQPPVYESSALRFDIPEALMKKMYPYIREADDWTSCLLRRSGAAGIGLSLRAIKSKRFGAMREPTERPTTR